MVNKTLEQCLDLKLTCNFLPCDADHSVSFKRKCHALRSNTWQPPYVNEMKTHAHTTIQGYIADFKYKNKYIKFISKYEKLCFTALMLCWWHCNCWYWLFLGSEVESRIVKNSLSSVFDGKYFKKPWVLLGSRHCYVKKRLIIKCRNYAFVLCEVYANLDYRPTHSGSCICCATLLENVGRCQSFSK